MREWRAYYADGNRIDGRGEAPPPAGVQVIVFRHDPPYRTFALGEDEYAWPWGGKVTSGTEMPAAAWETLKARAYAENP